MFQMQTFAEPGTAGELSPARLAEFQRVHGLTDREFEQLKQAAGAMFQNFENKTEGLYNQFQAIPVLNAATQGTIPLSPGAMSELERLLGSMSDEELAAVNERFMRENNGKSMMEVLFPEMNTGRMGAGMITGGLATVAEVAADSADFITSWTVGLFIDDYPSNERSWGLFGELNARVNATEATREQMRNGQAESITITKDELTAFKEKKAENLLNEVLDFEKDMPFDVALGNVLTRALDSLPADRAKALLTQHLNNSGMTVDAFIDQSVSDPSKAYALRNRINDMMDPNAAPDMNKVRKCERHAHECACLRRKPVDDGCKSRCGFCGC